MAGSGGGSVRTAHRGKVYPRTNRHVLSTVAKDTPIDERNGVRRTGPTNRGKIRDRSELHLF